MVQLAVPEFPMWPSSHSYVLAPLYFIRLSDKTSRLHPRHVVPKPTQAYETKVPVEVREWIGPAPASPDFVLVAQPPAQPRCGVVVECPVCLADRCRPHYSDQRPRDANEYSW